MRVYLAADHAGFALKQTLLNALREDGHEVTDLGAGVLNPADDYPDYIRPLAERVAGERGAFGIALGASGQGEAMVANRVTGARAAVYYGETREPQTDALGHTLDIIESARAHNDANILSLGARFLSEAEALTAVRRFLATPFSGEARHARRITKF